jgi:hypothetical protein
MPSSNESAYSNLVRLAHKPMTARELEISEQVEKFRKLHEIRLGYKGEWNAGARYFYSELSLVRVAGYSPRQTFDSREARRVVPTLPSAGGSSEAPGCVDITFAKRDLFLFDQVLYLVLSTSHILRGFSPHSQMNWPLSSLI